MHIYKITNIELANKLNVRAEYISMILNGKKSPKKAEERFLKAINELAKEREQLA